MGFAKPNRNEWQDWSYQIRAAANRINGTAIVTKYGNNGGIGGTTEDIWSNGGTLSFLTSAERHNVASDSINDDGSPAGTGAQTVTLCGLDADYNSITETVVMNGTTDVLTSKSFLRINRMRVATAGSGGFNDGAITATAQTSATVQAQIPASYGSTLKTQYTVPAGFYAYVLGVTFSTLNSDQVNVRLLSRKVDSGSWITLDNIDFASTTVHTPYEVPVVVDPKSDVKCTGQRISGTGTASVSARFEAILIKETLINSNSIV